MNDDLFSTEWRTKDRIKDALAEGRQTHFIRLAQSTKAHKSPREESSQRPTTLRKLVTVLGHMGR